jgi:hypothetical protein
VVWVSGHFGEWLQGRVAATGEVALVTLACPVRGASVSWDDAAALEIEDPAGLVGRNRVCAMLTELGLPLRGRVAVEPDLPPGGGAGMSTAALVALARAVGAREDRIVGACRAVEGAVDPLMLSTPDAVLWAPRAARVVRPVPVPPAAEIVGGFWGPPVATDPADTAFPPIDDLIIEWLKGPDLPQAARLASLSAARTTALRGPEGDPTAALAVDLGALGWARAHTGSARALIFAPGTAPSEGETRLRSAGYSHVLRFATGARS